MRRDMIGERLGQYDITAPLGKGGMATVFRATQTSMNRDVAIKIMNTELSQDEEFVSRFEREAQIFAVLQHPHILPVIDFGKSDGHIYIVMRLVEGGSLDERIRHNPLALPLASKLAMQIGSALNFAHDNGIIHRDLKPNNVLMDKNDNAYLTDFGLAKMAKGSALTRTDAIMGTPTYMAPEQWRGEGVDARTDVYAMGIMLYEMVTGKLPFQADTPHALMYKHMSAEPTSPRDHLESLPRQIEDVLLKSLAKQQEERFPSAIALAEAFKAATEGKVAASMQQVQLRPPSETQPSSLTAAANRATEKITEWDATVTPGQLMDVDTATMIGTAETRAHAASTGGHQTSILDAPVVDTPQPAPQANRQPLIIGVITAVVLVAAGVGGFLLAQANGWLGTSGDTINLSQIPERLAYNRSTTESQDIYASSADGTNTQFIGTGGKPAWSWDNQSILFDSEFTGNAEVFSISADGFDMQNLTQNPALEFFGVYSPDGETIAFHSNRDEDFNIYIMDRDGSNQRQVTTDSANDQWPAWSPDGSLIAFSSIRDGNFEIYTIQPDGENLQRITESPGADFWATWSPDGSQIAFHSNRDGNLEIYAMNADGSNVLRLTENDADDQWPSWSTSGVIAFSSNRDGNQEIYVIRPDGTGLTRVTETASDERFPTWSYDR